MRALGGAHQVLEAGQVGEAGHGGEHPLVGVGAVGEEAVEQQTLLGQLVEVGGDAVLVAHGADIAAGEALHEDHHHVADRQGAFGRRGVVAANGGLVRIHQLVVGGQQHLAHGGQGFILGQGGLPGVVPVGRETVLGGVHQGQGAVQAQLVGEHRVGGEGVAPAQRRALAQMAASGDHGHYQADHEDGQAAEPGRGAAGGRCFAGADARTARQVEAAEQQVEQAGGQGPGDQVAAHREAVPDHAGDRAQVFLQVLEDQAVQALVELAVEVQLADAEEQRQAGEGGQPQAMQAAGGHGAGAEQREQQRHAGEYHHAQVEAQAVVEGLDEDRGRAVADLVAVVRQQRDAQQAVHDHQRRGAEQGEGQVALDGGGVQAERGLPGGDGFLCGHAIKHPEGSRRRAGPSGVGVAGGGKTA
ncbi:hypothetical protein D9M69_173040 [compost metagenome]